MSGAPGSSVILAVILASSLPQTLNADELSIQPAEIDAVGDLHPENQARKALQDTIWIADWSFDAGAVCDDSGWVRVDNRILNDGAVHWNVTNTFAGIGGISGLAAALGYTG